MMSGIPAPNKTLQLISNEGMAQTRDLGNELGASERMLTQGMLTPNFPDSADTGTRIADMEHLVRDLGIRALKTYTGAGYGVFGPDIAPWWLDDEQVAYPMYEEALRLGLNIVNTHKAPPRHLRSRAHQAARRPQGGARLAADQLRHLSLRRRVHRRSGRHQAQPARQREQRLLSRRDLRGDRLADDSVTAIGHLLGKLTSSFGADHVLWGTDSIWYGSRSGRSRR